MRFGGRRRGLWEFGARRGTSAPVWCWRLVACPPQISRDMPVSYMATGERTEGGRLLGGAVTADCWGLSPTKRVLGGCHDKQFANSQKSSRSSRYSGTSCFGCWSERMALSGNFRAGVLLGPALAKPSTDNRHCDGRHATGDRIAGGTREAQQGHSRGRRGAIEGHDSGRVAHINVAHSTREEQISNRPDTRQRHPRDTRDTRAAPRCQRW